ncbi:MFS general substrate transporter [Phlegmacium glaucopus]|nr:MFS general substrate transporter [Phlegmacium glaucopus]
MEGTNIHPHLLLVTTNTTTMNNSITVPSHKPPSSTPADDAHKLVKTGTEFSNASSVPVAEIFDIEHVPVENDPRAWSSLRKNATLVLIATASMISGLATNIQNPAVSQMEVDLPATSSQFSLSIAVFVLLQGLMPLLWCAMSELVYILSLGIFTLGNIIVALSRRIGLVIGFRCLQAAGSSAVLSIGAATLADIFDPKERGKKMGIYYMAPLLGPALGPIFGGVLTSTFNWRATFWFLSILSGSSLLIFILFFHDTFRRQRSLTYQNVLKQRRRAGGLTPLEQNKICW